MSEPRVGIEVWSDYACPWCFLAATSLDKLEGSHNVDVQWRAYELRPKGSPPMPAEYKARIDENKPRLLAMAKEQYGLDLNQGPFGIDSRPALIGAKFAQEAGKGREYHYGVMRAYWLDAQNIGEVEVLADIAEGIGLDRKDFLTALDNADLDAAVQHDVDQAREFGLNSVPAMVFDQRYLVSGAQPYPVLVQATEHVQQEMAQA